jgi:hypothetical protein
MFSRRVPDSPAPIRRRGRATCRRRREPLVYGTPLPRFSIISIGFSVGKAWDSAFPELGRTPANTQIPSPT